MSHDPVTEGLTLFLRSLENAGTLGKMRRIFCEVVTPSECEDIAQRMIIAERLHRGHSYRSIAEEVGVSTTTVTKVARMISEWK